MKPRAAAYRAGAAGLLALAALLSASIGGPARSAGAEPCADYSLLGLRPGMLLKEVRAVMGGDGKSLDPVPGPFGPSHSVVYTVESGETVIVQFDRDAAVAPLARVAGVLVRGGRGSADPSLFKRIVRETYGEPNLGRESLDGGLRSGSAIWSGEGCDAELSAFREGAAWWDPAAGYLSLQVRSKRYAAALEEWKRTGKILPPPAASEASDVSADTPVLSLVGVEVTPPSRIPEACPPPKHPRLAQRMQMGARVHVSVVVRADGSVSDVTVLETDRPGMGFEKATVQAVRKWHFVPGTRAGAPTESVTELWVEFE
jgi:TonB family protein